MFEDVPLSDGYAQAVTPRTSTAFINWLVARHKPLEPVLDEHLNDYDELLSHVFFGDVTRHAAHVARRAETETEAADELTRLLDDLESAFLLGDERDEVDDLIWVSFIENAQGVPNDDEESLRDALRRYPRLSSALSHYE